MTDELPRVAKGEPLHAYIRRHLDEGGRLAGDGADLPDEPEVDGGMRWAPGALDGVFSHHGGGDHGKRAAEVAARLAKACARPSERRLRALYETVTGDDVLSLVDPLLEELTRLQPDRAAVRRIGAWLASAAPERGPVKVGLALLGAAGLDGHVDLVRTLGAHDEFTLYAAVALCNGLEHPDSELWALAASVDGWGRIHCVERLRDTQDPQIRAWILREGFRNSVMDEYLACLAAETGGLLAALTGPSVDRALLTAAGEILVALINGGPAEDMSDYADGADAVEAYVALMRTRAETFGDLLAVAAVRDYVSADDGPAGPGWSTSRGEAFAAACTEILGRPQWRDRVAAALHSDDPAEFWEAGRAARELGIDIFDVLVARLERDPLGNDWFEAWQLADAARAGRLAELARRLPLAEVATGLGDEMGFGPGFEVHRALEWTLQALDSYPGVGGDLLLAGLGSPVTRNRNMALRALQRWPRESWPAGAVASVERLAAADPNSRAREFAGQVLRGEPPED